MKIRIKRAVSFLVVLCLCWSFMPTYVNAAGNITICGVDIGIAAGSYMQFTTRDGTNSNSGYYYNGYYLAASQCFGFARWCQYKLFGYTSYSNSSGFYKISVNGVSDIAAGSLTTTNLKALITAAKPGAHLRTHENSNGVAHSMVITEVTDSGFSIAQCNGSNNNEYSSWKQNYVGTYTYTWSSYVSSTYGSRGIDYIEMPYDYPYTGLTPANLGTEFMGVILNTNAWKPIGVDSDGFVHLETEAGASHQLWKFIRQDDGSYTISSAKTGKLLEMYCGATTAGNPVAAVSDDWGGNYQRWYLYPQGNGYVLLSKHFTDLNLVMDLTGNNSADGTAITTCPRNNSNAQIWSIYTGSECQLSGPPLTVTAGDSATTTKFTWGEVYGESRYDLKIWKGNLWEGDAYHIEWGAKSGFSMQLPAGTYTAYVDGVNNFDAIMGNSVTFTVKEHSHSYSSVVTNPTCTAQGYTTYTCKTCGYSYKGSYTGSLGHNYSYKVSTAPTVSAIGKLTGTCSRCSGTTMVTLPKLNTTDYTYQVTKAPTCETTGTGRYTWKTTTYGTFDFVVTIAKTGHSYSTVVTAPTCSAQGYTTHTCSGCGDSYKDTYTSALGHNYSYKVSTTPTVFAAGNLMGICSRCSGTTTVTLPKLNTTDYYYQIVVAADCTTEGVGRYTWNTTVYGNYIFDVIIPQTGHSYGKVVTDPTCTERGYTTYTCPCGDSYVDDYVDATGHNYENGSCAGCGEPDPDYHPSLYILSQPDSYVGSVNDDVTFTVEASGNGLTYAWFYSDDGGASWKVSHSPGYLTNSLQPILRAYRDGYLFYCRITDVFGNSVDSDIVSMVVKSSEITITEQPADVESGIVNQLYTFKVTATGDNLTYRWEYSEDGGNTWLLSWNQGYNADTLKVRLYAYRSGYLYRCVVTSGLKTVLVSEPAELILQDPSVEITSQSGNVSTVNGKTISFHVDATGNDLTYAWYRSNDKGATWTATFLSGYNTDTLSFVANSNRAAMYMCKITDGSGKVVWSEPVKLTILSAELKILTQPTDVTCANGATASFTVEAQGDALRYLWYASSDGGETWTATYLSGYNTSTLSFTVNASRASKLYKCVITDAGGNTVETNAVSVTIG